MARLITQSQFARKTKYSRARISQLVKQGVIILKNQKVDPAQAEPAIEANIDRSRRLKSEAKVKVAQSSQMDLLPNGKSGFNNEPQNGKPTGPFNIDPQNGKPTLTDSRRDLVLLNIEKTEIEIKQRRGQLVPKGEATKMVIALGSATKLAFLNLPRRLAEILFTMVMEALWVAIKELPPATQNLLEPVIRNLKFNSKEIEILLRSEIKNIIHILEQSHHAKPKHIR
jgi:hypothetical protein